MTDLELILTNQLMILSALQFVPKASDNEVNAQLYEAIRATEAHLEKWHRSSIRSGFGQS